MDRRQAMGTIGAGFLASSCSFADVAAKSAAIKITKITITPIALPDPPLLAAGGCHGPYFLRNVIQIETDAGITGIGETKGGLRVTQSLEKARGIVVGKNPFAYRVFAEEVAKLSPAAYAGIELACLDICGKATGRRICELLGGPVRNEVEFAAYLFYRYSADHPKLLADPRIVDSRGKGAMALDDWGEVRTPEAMVQEAERFRKQWGFRVFKLKAGVLSVKAEIETMEAMQQHFGGLPLLRIDPNGKWKVDTAIAAGKTLKKLKMEYYEDPVRTQAAMAEVRKAVGIPMSTNMCVTRFEHIPEAIKREPIDVVLCYHHGWGGIPACQELGRICKMLGWKMSQHSNNHAGITMAAMIHVGAVCPELTVASDTHYPWLPDRFDIIQGGKLPIKGGRMIVPEKPGLGVDIDPDALARAIELYRKSGMRERDDAGTLRLIEPEFKADVLY